MSEDDSGEDVSGLSKEDKGIINEALKTISSTLTKLEGLSEATEDDGDIEDAKSKLEEASDLLQGAVGGEEEA